MGPAGAAVEDHAGASPARPAPARSPPASGSARPAVPTSGPPAPAAAQPVPPEVATHGATCRECGGDVADDGYCTSAAPGRPSLRDHFTEQPAAGWRPCATAASGTPATRTPSPCTPGPSRAATPCSWSATGCPRRPTRTSPAWRPLGPPATSWPPPTRRGMGTAATRVAASAQALEAAADAANEAVIAHTTPGPGNPASCTFVAAVVRRAAPRRRAGSATAGPTGCPTPGTPGC